MYMPFDSQRKEMENLIWDIIKSPDFKNQLSTYIRMEIEASKNKYSKDNTSNTLSYDMLTRGNVDMQAKMAASGYDVYGRTLIPSNCFFTNPTSFNKAGVTNVPSSKIFKSLTLIVAYLILNS